MPFATAQPPPHSSPPVLHPDAPKPGTVLPAHYSRCFGCGVDHPTGLKLRVSVAEGVAVETVFRVGEDHQGAPGLAHGGVLAAALDETLGYLNWLIYKPAVTGRLETDFLRPVPVGSELHVVARCLGVRGRKIYVNAEGRLAGRVAVRAAGVFVAVPLSHFVEHGAPPPADAATVERPYNP